jgi:heme-degrading monooxygenase HmoA
MVVAINTLPVEEGGAGAVHAIWEERIPLIERLGGFQRSFFGVTPDKRAAIVLVAWDRLEDVLSAQEQPEFIDTMRTVGARLAGPPQRQLCCVAGDTQLDAAR